jgi:hypothetical protein
MAGDGASRIVPQIFQAKRYSRPNADVSQSHAVRGTQYHLLAQNKCAAAYIFYENGRQRIELPLPPLVKPVENVEGPTHTSVFSGTYDLSGYFVNAVMDARFAVGSQTAEEALRMIFARATADQLARGPACSTGNTTATPAPKSTSITAKRAQPWRVSPTILPNM